MAKESNNVSNIPPIHPGPNDNLDPKKTATCGFSGGLRGDSIEGRVSDPCGYSWNERDKKRGA